MKIDLTAPSSPLVGYVVVGSVGFAVDGGIMQALFSLLSWDALAARAISFPAAVTVTWILNRNWTFNRYETKVSHKKYALYLMTMIVGSLVNVLVFAATIHLVPMTQAYPLVALAVGAGVALVLTYSVSTYVIFAQTEREEG